MDIKQAKLVSQLKQLASKLGEIPTRSQYRDYFGYDYEYTFGTYAVFKQAAGLNSKDDSKEKKKEKKRKINSFGKWYIDDLLELESKLAPVEIQKFGPYPLTVMLGDLHEPFSCDESIEHVYTILGRLKDKVKYIVTMGDDYDMLSFGSFARSHLIINPKDEIEIARKRLEKIWSNIKKICPKAKKVALLGNHNIRPYKKVLNQAPELEVFMDLHKWFEFDGVKTIKDPREPFMIKDAALIHGWASSKYVHVSTLNSNVCHGHTHKGSLWVEKLNGVWRFNLDVGYLGDPSKPCFNYTPTKEAKWTRGLGLLHELGPSFLPFE